MFFIRMRTRATPEVLVAHLRQRHAEHRDTVAIRLRSRGQVES
jgi:hypothetical protein